MNPETILHERGNVAVVVHKNQLSREEKDAVRYSDQIVAMGDYYGLLIQEEPEDMAAFDAHHTPEPGHVCDNNDDCEFHEYQGPKDEEPVVEPVMPPNTPTIPDELEGLTVAQLKEIAETEEIDISDVKLKADIVGRIWGAREMRAEQEG